MFHSNCHFAATGQYICTRGPSERFEDQETMPVSSTVRIPNTGLHNNPPTCRDPTLRAYDARSEGRAVPVTLKKKYARKLFTEGVLGIDFDLACQPTCQHTYYSLPQGCDATCKQLSGNPNARAVGSNKISDAVTQCACEFPENAGCALPPGFRK